MNYKRIAAFVCGVTIVYTVACFITLDLNPVNWGMFGRTNFVLICLAVLFFTAFDDTLKD